MYFEFIRLPFIDIYARPIDINVLSTLIICLSIINNINNELALSRNKKIEFFLSFQTDILDCRNIVTIVTILMITRFTCKIYFISKLTIIK